MPQLPGMKGEVFFGDTEVPLPDWRAGLVDSGADDDADEITPGERKALVGMLGFDPREELARDSTSV